MAKYRALQVNFWDDGFTLDLTPEEKYFYIYLLTNSRTSQCGCYELPYKIIEMQTGYNRETVEKLLGRFIEYGKIEYNKETKEILIINWSKHNFTKSPKVMNCILKEIEDIKNVEFKRIMYDLCLDFGYPIDTLSIDYGEKEKQKEKQKQKEKEKQQQGKNKIPKDVVVDNIKNNFRNLNDEEIESIAIAFFKTEQDIDYLKEQIEAVKSAKDVRNIVGFLITALDNGYKAKGYKKKSMFHNFDENFNNGAKEELMEKIRRSQKDKFG